MHVSSNKQFILCGLMQSWLWYNQICRPSHSVHAHDIWQIWFIFIDLVQTSVAKVLQPYPYFTKDHTSIIILIIDNSLIGGKHYTLQQSCMHLRIVKLKFMHPGIGATVPLHPLMIFLILCTPYYVHIITIIILLCAWSAIGYM